MGEVEVAMWVGVACGRYTRNVTDYAVYWQHCNVQTKKKKRQPTNYVADLYKLNVSWFMAVMREIEREKQRLRDWLCEPVGVVEAN